MILMLFEVTKNFPRENKYTLGQDIKRDGLTLVRSIYRANKDRDKTEHLEQFLDNFEILKLELRLCADLNILPLKKQSRLAQVMEGIGKQVNGLAYRPAPTCPHPQYKCIENRFNPQRIIGA